MRLQTFYHLKYCDDQKFDIILLYRFDLKLSSKVHHEKM